MNHENKNPLLALYFHEGKEKTERKIQEHAATCQDCREYLEILAETEHFLKAWPDEKPDPRLFERILSRIPETPPGQRQERQALSALPLAGIAGGIAFIVFVLSLVQTSLTRLPLWDAIQHNWIVQAIGSFGVSVILFFAAAAFAVLSLAPFFYFSSQKSTPGYENTSGKL
jgi:predicted anti-sigma-YlaC factor YlaD